ncbi:MAG: DNA-processing protein DprA [Atribacterota bacterium]|nr:DNA-processing protein DprA [Candidatus Atribacteria bacterium]MDD3539200.1 DNA-processing protein DprA [Atribacterota bacterium]MDD5497212.1 DNA-processing protein DprA [Atribacterota bacterium]
MEKEELKYWLAWNRIKEIGPVRFSKLRQHFPSLKEAWFCNLRTNNIMNLLHIGEETLTKIEQEKRKIDPDFELELVTKMDIKVITIEEEGYPHLLKNIYSPPPVIYYQGEFTAAMKQEKGIAIVGSRKATYYGKKVAREIAGGLAASGYIIISGLAKGIDTNAHLGALEVDGLTIAVLGGGLDRIYPSENKALAHRIRNKGAIITEFPLYTKPEKNNFPRRNRIISGLALGTLVVEAPEKSGALITADFALEQGREVFAIPGSIHSYLSAGCHNLIKEGAKLVNNYQDILEEFEERNKILSDRKNTENKEQSYIIPESLTDCEKKILQHISIEPLHIDELTELVLLSPGQVSEALLSLELKNLIREIEGKRYIRI